MRRSNQSGVLLHIHACLICTQLLEVNFFASQAVRLHISCIRVCCVDLLGALAVHNQQGQCRGKSVYDQKNKAQDLQRVKTPQGVKLPTASKTVSMLAQGIDHEVGGGRVVSSRQ